MAGSVPLGGPGLLADPREGRRSVSEAVGNYPRLILKNLHDSDVTLEEYMHYAKISRDEERRLYGPGTTYYETPGPLSYFAKTKIARKESISSEGFGRRLSLVEAVTVGKDGFFGKEKGFLPDDRRTSDARPTTDGGLEPNGGPTPNGRPEPFEITDEEWINASRAARTATWGAIFYLIATDILGPFSTGWAFSQLGWGPAVALYTVFGALSGYTGY